MKLITSFNFYFIFTFMQSSCVFSCKLCLGKTLNVSVFLDTDLVRPFRLCRVIKAWLSFTCLYWFGDLGPFSRSQEFARTVIFSCFECELTRHLGFMCGFNQVRACWCFSSARWSARTQDWDSALQVGRAPVVLTLSGLATRWVTMVFFNWRGKL